MPVHKKENSTSQPKEGVEERETKAILSGGESFREYVRGEIRQATRIVMEEIMREELTEFVGVQWGESSSDRKGYRNGYYTRDLRTTHGPIEDRHPCQEIAREHFKPRCLSAMPDTNRKLRKGLPKCSFRERARKKWEKW